MSTVVNIADHKKIKTKLVCSGCGAPGEGSCGCGVAYVAPGERAEAAVKANPEKSDRAIADELGVGKDTVRRARKSGGAHAPTEKRTGKDGKQYKATKPKPSSRRTPVEKFDAVVKARQQGKTQTEAAAEAGLGSVQPVKIAEAYDQGRADLLHELNVDPDTLALSATAKLEAAKRALERKLNAEHAARMRDLNEEVRQRVLAETKEYLAMLKSREEEAEKLISTYREFTNNHKATFTVDEFKTILMCLHPDGQRTQEKLSSAFRLFNSKKVQLTGEK